MRMLKHIVPAVAFTITLTQGAESMEKGLTPEAVVKIGLIGDSTVAQQSGWGPAFASRFNDQVQVLNHAVNGATLQSLSNRLDALVKHQPDYVLIQFGHNDQKRYDTNGYSARLRSYVERIRKAGGKPIILSSVTRRTFSQDGKIVSRLVKSKQFTFKANLTAYAQAAQAVAAELRVPFIDLHTISVAHHNKIGPEASMAYNFKEGDLTHFNGKGGQAVTDLILPELKRVAPELTTHLLTGKAEDAAGPGTETATTNRPAGESMKEVHVNPTEQKAFEQASSGNWQEVFADPCTDDWHEKWFLDGEIGTVTSGPTGMELTAGPEFRNDAHHMVLWTKESFEGDLKIEYDYTRLDNEKRCVTILYIQATGSGEGPYAKDISEWNELRRVPSMKTYFNNMNTYHISYAAFPNFGDDRTSYIRGRRYMPNKTGLRGTDLDPDYFPEGLFATGIEHRVTVIKKDRDLYMRVENPDGVSYFHMTNPELPVITEGRIGLRHMFTRSARYRNIRIAAAQD